MRPIDFEFFVLEHTATGDKRLDSIFTLNALAGEVGELCNVAKKEIWYQLNPVYRERIDKEVAEGKKDHREQKVDEAGDVLFYLVQYLNKEHITLDEVMEYQKKKILDQHVEFNCKYKK